MNLFKLSVISIILYIENVKLIQKFLCRTYILTLAIVWNVKDRKIRYILSITANCKIEFSIIGVLLSSRNLFIRCCSIICRVYLVLGTPFVKFLITDIHGRVVMRVFKHYIRWWYTCAIWHKATLLFIREIYDK